MGTTSTEEVIAATTAEAPKAVAVATSSGNGNGKTRVTLVRGLLLILALDIAGLIYIGYVVQRFPTQQWDIVKEVVGGLLTLATVLASGLVGMAKGTTS